MHGLTPELIHYLLSVSYVVNHADFELHFYCQIKKVRTNKTIYYIGFQEIIDLTVSKAS